MRASSLAATVVVLPLMTVAATVSLGDFSPRVVGTLSTSCESAYTQEISACSPADFAKSGPGCSAVCGQALQALITTVKKDCGNEDFSGSADYNNILVYFLDGSGPQKLCKNYADIFQSTTTVMSTATAKVTSVSTATSSPKDTTSSSKATSQAISSGSITSSATLRVTAPVATSSESSAMTSEATVLETASTTSSTTAPSSSHSSNNDGSGGGSPFDYASDSTILSKSIGATLLAAILVLVVEMR